MSKTYRNTDKQDRVMNKKVKQKQHSNDTLDTFTDNTESGRLKINTKKINAKKIRFKNE